MHSCFTALKVLRQLVTNAERFLVLRLSTHSWKDKPDVVLYEEPLNEQITLSAIDVISSADMLIIGGTSLAVYPAAGFLRYFKGDNIVLINRDETQYDEMATIVFRDSIGEVLSKTLNAVMVKRCSSKNKPLNNE